LGEANIALDHVSHVGDVVAEHQSPLDSHTEGKALVLVGVDSCGEEDVSVHHAAAAPFDPAGTVAESRMPNIHFGARLSKGEIVRPQAHFGVLAKHRLRQMVQRASEVRHGEAAVNRDSLNLVEHRRVGGIELVGSIHPSGRDDIDRQLSGEKRAHLNR